jgi:hypothetical protein
MPRNDLEELKENEQVDKLTKKEEELERLINRLNQDWGVDINRKEVENLRLAYREQWKKLGRSNHYYWWKNFNNSKKNLNRTREKNKKLWSQMWDCFKYWCFMRKNREIAIKKGRGFWTQNRNSG